MEITETTFRLMDVIYIIVAVAGGLGFYWKMVMNDKQQETKIHQMKKDVEKNESVMFKKFSNVHSRMEKNEEKTKTEFDLINSNVNEMKIGIGAINGKLDILIGQNK